MEAELERAAARHDSVREPEHWSALAQMVAGARARRGLLGREEEATASSAARPAFRCPAAGAGVGYWGTKIEEFHYDRHRLWAEGLNYCERNGLWTSGCKSICPLRAATIGTVTGLAPGQLVLDVGSGCGHYAFWLNSWFGAHTVGVDFVEPAVDFANREVAPTVPSQFCWFNVASEGLSFVPPGSVDLALAVSVLHYLRTDSQRWERKDSSVQGHSGPAMNRTQERTPCGGLPQTRRTQCFVAREMFRTVRVGGHVWIYHNGSYKRKWDPKRVWGPQYWQCCFGPELRAASVQLLEVPEHELFIHGANWDPTYSVVLRRLRPETGAALGEAAAQPAGLL